MSVAGRALCLLAVALLAGCGQDENQAADELAAARGRISKERRAVESQLASKRDEAAAALQELRDQSASARQALRKQRAKVAAERRKLRRLQRQVSGARAQVAANTLPGDGTFVVGEDIQPGTYRAAASPGCYWERDSSLDGGIDSIIENANADGPVVIQVSPTDKAVKTTRCADFHRTG